MYVALNPSALKSDGLALLGLTGDPDFDRQDAIVAGTARDEKSKRAIEDYCLSHTASEVDRDFNKVNIGCCKIMDYSELGDNPHCLKREASSNGSMTLRDRWCGEWALCPEWSEGPATFGAAPPAWARTTRISWRSWATPLRI